MYTEYFKRQKYERSKLELCQVTIAVPYTVVNIVMEVFGGWARMHVSFRLRTSSAL